MQFFVHYNKFRIYNFNSFTFNPVLRQFSCKNKFTIALLTRTIGKVAVVRSVCFHAHYKQRYGAALVIQRAMI